MDAFSSSPVMENFPEGSFDSRSVSPSLSPIPSPTKTEVDDGDFPVEMDESFNSSMSFAFNESPPQPSPSMFLGKANMLPHSPTPTFRMPRRNTVASKSFHNVFDENPRGLTSLAAPPSRRLGASRTFGSDLTNTKANGPSRQLFFPSSNNKGKGKMLPPAAFDYSSTKAISPAPLKSTLSQENMGTPRHILPRMGRRESAPTLESPARGSEVMMDVDSPGPSGQCGGQEDDLGAYFEASPAPAVVPTKRHFTLSSPPGSPSSSSPLTRHRGHDRSISTSGVVFGGARANTLASRRDPPYRRPALQPLAPVGGHLPRASTASAYPIMNGPKTIRHASIPGVRRTLSMFGQNDGSDDDTDMDASPSIVDQRRYGRVDVRDAINGSPGVRTAIPRVPYEPKTAVPGPLAFFNGMPDFGTEERLNKVLPCHTVKDDGLVRITPQTMCDLLAGRFSDSIGRFHIIDCRFPFEFDGGHIEGAINVRSEEHLEELLLTPSSGYYERTPLPTPSLSGELSPSERVVIIFHCEFSKMRAPTFAKSFRSRDRSINHQVYPQCHYPELYILEGGYKSFFELAPKHCEPQAYVRMVDPEHEDRCKTDMAKFDRTFGRTRSLTCVESQLSTSRLALAPPISLAAGTAAQGRRGTRAHRVPITEENEPDSSPVPNASPTPRALSMGQAPLFGSARPRLTFERAPLQRFASDAMLLP